MFVPTGWRDWELVMAALLYAWAALAVASLLAFGVAYGLFREHSHSASASPPGQAGRAGQAAASTVAPSTVYVTPARPSPAAVPAAEPSRETSREWAAANAS
jgi:hypothetical protein